MQAGTKGAGAQDAATGGRDLDCDVLVVGMGFSGPVAALRALECGAKVIAIDKQARGWWTPGGAMMIHSELHIAFRSMSEPESVLIREMNAVTDGMIPRELLETTARNAGRAMQWIMGHGAEFETNRYRLINSYHCSRLNTNTGRLTTPMFHAVFDGIRDVLATPAR